jgi:DNA (cytosine-5)-methyltransferase 1
MAGGHIDVLLGCPPCQGFSDVGERDPNDPRNRHLERFGRFAAALRPLAVVMENVPLAASSPQFTRFARRLERAGYRWTASIVNAAMRGSAQCRHRIVFVAFRDDTGIDPSIPAPTHGGGRQYFSYRTQKMSAIVDDPVALLGVAPGARRRGTSPFAHDEHVGDKKIPYVAEVLDGLPTIGSAAAKDLAHVPWKHSPMQRKRMGAVREGGRWAGGADHFSQSYGRLHRKGLARTITTNFNNPGSGRFWHPTENRALTPREAARLQGFPDSFQFTPHYTWSARLIGNALDSSISSMAYDAVRAALE